MANTPPPMSPETYFKGAVRLLYTTAIREEEGELRAYAQQFGVTAEEISDLALQHIQSGSRDWPVRTVKELAGLLEGDTLAAEKLFAYQWMEQTARVLLNRHWDLSQTLHKRDARSILASPKIVAAISESRSELVRQVQALSGESPGYTELLVDGYISNLRQHLGLEERIQQR